MEILYLAHHGVLGQKWGVRRYQNEDGSLTSLGKKRRENANSLTRNAGIRNSDVLKKARKEDINSLSTAELKSYNDRLSAENNFINLTSGSIKKGRDWTDSTAKTIVTSIVTGVATAAGSAFIKNKFGV